MPLFRWIGHILIGIIGTIVLSGCIQRPAVPTVPAEPTEPVVVIVVTATSQPTLVPSSTAEPTITPLPTFTPIETKTVTATVRAATVVQATRPPATAAAVQPTQPPTASAPPATAPPASFAAPMVFAPTGKAFRDGDTVTLQFASVGPLESNQCYRFDMTLINPGIGQVGDWWVGLCGDQSNAGDPLKFEVFNRKQFAAPNYGSLLDKAEAQISGIPMYEMQSTVTVVHKLTDDGSYKPSVEALSPASASLQNSFFR